MTAAEDAFGVTIGRETLGLYTSSSVRGFSPTTAGNSRIDGLYFDQVWALNSRLRTSSTIRVGPSAQSYPFPAPTGIVDQSFRKPGDEASLSLLASANEWGGAALEADGVLPLGQGLSVGLGAAALEEEYYNATSGSYRNAGASLRWTPAPQIEVVPFGAISEATDAESGPIYVPAGAYLPPRVARRSFDGPSWADYESTAVNYGVLAQYLPRAGWRTRLGLFRSQFDDRETYANLLLNQRPDGTAERLIVADPSIALGSTSGDLRITRVIGDESRLHLLHLSLRARERTRRYDGSDTLALGTTLPGEPVTIPKPEFEFGPQTRDRVYQRTAGFAYELRWSKRAELGIGLQRSAYEKRVERPSVSAVLARDNPWLYNVSGAYALGDALTAYASFTRGLEESGTAPDTASNRGEALPAIRTRQADAGVRYAFTPTLRLITGVFEIAKPYFTLDSANRFVALGEVTHRGVEISLSGAANSRLNIVAGAVLMEPEVSGPDVSSGSVGPRPVGQAKRLLLLNADWRPPVAPNVSLDVAVKHTSRMPATRDNLVELPSRTLIDIGARYRFRLGRAPATLRLQLTNSTDEYGYQLKGSGAYDVIPGRQASAYLAVDL